MNIPGIVYVKYLEQCLVHNKNHIIVEKNCLHSQVDDARDKLVT